MSKIIDKEWDFIVKEVHKGYQDNRIERELLFLLECELSKKKPNMKFYYAIKELYQEKIEVPPHILQVFEQYDINGHIDWTK